MAGDRSEARDTRDARADAKHASVERQDAEHPTATRLLRPSPVPAVLVVVSRHMARPSHAGPAPCIAPWCGLSLSA